jgi:hypothetical protein
MIMAPTVTVNDLHAVNICLNKVLFIQKWSEVSEAGFCTLFHTQLLLRTITTLFASQSVHKSHQLPVESHQFTCHLIPIKNAPLNSSQAWVILSLTTGETGIIIMVHWMVIFIYIGMNDHSCGNVS